MAAAPDWPADALEVARIVDAWGVKGWVKVQPFSGDPQALFSTPRWFVKPPEGSGLRPILTASGFPAALDILQVRHHGDGLVALPRGSGDRSAAEALRGARLFVARSSFPTAGIDEFYWVDLIGLDVINRDGVRLGKVVGLLDTGPHSVLRVGLAGAAEGVDGNERLIPFVAAYVDAVSLADRRITVDWGLDY